MNAVAWSDDRQSATYGKILHEDLFDGNTTICDNFGREKKFKTEFVDRVGISPTVRVKELEKTLKKLVNSLESSIMICNVSLS